MKINISVGQDEFLTGYTNIDPISKPEGLAVDIRNLDSVASDSECTEIIAVDVLDFLEGIEAEQVLKHWIKKLRHNGKIVIGGVDAYEVSKLLYHGRISLEDFNYLIHGQFSAPWDVKMNHMTLEYVETLMKDSGLQVTKKRIKDYSFIVEGERP